MDDLTFDPFSPAVAGIIPQGYLDSGYHIYPFKL
jgi:hypothetical protein